MDVNERIKDHIESNPVVLFMKGTPQMPMCGFSSRTSQELVGGCDIVMELNESGELNRMVEASAKG